MSSAAQYQRGQTLRVRIEGHPEPVQMASIGQPGFSSGGGLMLVVDRGNVDSIVQMLNAGAEVEARRQSELSAGGAKDWNRW